MVDPDADLCQMNKCLIFQIYDMILVRHGLMIVGDPLGGKTTAFKVLAEALADLHHQELMDEFGVCNVVTTVINLQLCIHLSKQILLDISRVG